VRLNVTLYRVMAYITGVVLIVLCVLAILQVTINDGAAVNAVGTVHGLLYIAYLVVAYPLTRRLRLHLAPTVAVLLAGTIPVMTFVVERRVSHTYIGPALAGVPPGAAGGERAGGETAGGAAAGGAAAGGAAARGETARGETARGETAGSETAGVLGERDA
jgi:integral membrane protein